MGAKNALRFPLRTKHRQIPQSIKRFRGGEKLQGLQGLLLVFGQKGLGLLRVFAVEDVVAELEEDAEVEAEIRDLSDLFGGSTNRHGTGRAAGAH